MSEYVHGHQADYVGMIQEDIYNVNKITDFTAAETYCNPVFSNEDNAPNITVDKLDEGISKVLNSRHLASLTDNKNGRTAHILTLGGNLKNGGLGYILQTCHQVVSWDETNMIYKLEEEGNSCRTNSYTFYVPRSCSSTKKGFIATGCDITTLEIDHKTQTWTATFDCAGKDEDPVSSKLPTIDNYRDVATIDKSNYSDTFGQLTIAGDVQETTSLTQTITFTKADNLGLYGVDGLRTGFIVIGVSCEIAFTLPYSDTVETNNKSKTYWIAATGEPQTGQFGITNTSDANNSIEISCYGVMNGITRETPGGDIWGFSGTIMVQQNKEDSTTDYTLTHKDTLGDITANF